MTGSAPHIFLIITDQQRFDTINATGAAWMDTPILDRLVREGVYFENCFVNAPSCVPSRAALFSGIEPQASGVLRNGQIWSRTWVTHLAEAGYHCVSIGKMHTIPYDAAAGFHERFVVENKDRFYEGRWFADELDKAIAAHKLAKPSRAGYRELPDYRDRLGAVDWSLPRALHPDVFVAETAAWWLATRPKPERLFMQIGFPGPHPPYDPPPDESRRYLARDDLPVPAPTGAELALLPAYLKEKRRHDVEVDHDAVAWKLDPTREELHRLRAHYAAGAGCHDRKREGCNVQRHHERREPPGLSGLVGGVRLRLACRAGTGAVGGFRSCASRPAPAGRPDALARFGRPEGGVHERIPAEVRGGPGH
jgi:arylsulfatase